MTAHPITRRFPSALLLFCLPAGLLFAFWAIQERSAPISGQAQDAATGVPIANLKVVLVQVPDDGPEDAPHLLHESTRTDPLGRYGFSLPPPGRFLIFPEARAAGYLPPVEGPVALTITPGQLSIAQDFQLRPGARLRGKVQRPDGGPAADVPVAAIRIAAATETPSLPQMPTDIDALATKTDHDGTYELNALDPNRPYRIRADAPNLAATTSEIFETPGSGEKIEINLVLREGVRVSGRAQRPDGAPLAAVRLTLFPAFGAQEGDLAQGLQARPIESESDDAGQFTFEHAAPGRYLINGPGGAGRPADAPGDPPLYIDVGEQDLVGVALVFLR